MKLSLVLGGAAAATTSVSGAQHRVYHLVGVDVVGKDFDNKPSGGPIECAWKCGASQRCSATTWTNYNGGTCWLKDTGFKGAPTAPKTEAESYIFLSDSTSTYIWSATKDGFDMAGYDIGNAGGNDMGECMSKCNKNGDCFAVTWTNYQGGWCWFKSHASGYVAKAGAKVAYVAREIPST